MEEKNSQKTLYQTIKEKKTAADMRLYTVVSGEHAGEKLLLSDGRTAWKTPGSTFLEQAAGRLEALPCGCIKLEGQEVFCEELEGCRHMVVCGGGHVATAVIRLAKTLGFWITVLEDRPLFADRARAAGADQVICEPFIQGMEKIPGSGDTYFVIVTRGHRYDYECLQAAYKKPFAYLGMMGSHRRVAMIRKRLEGDGILPEKLDALHAPIGLEIGAETPEEIAVSIMAEVIRVRSARRKKTGYEDAVLDALLDPQDSQKKVQAVIIERKGSAPRAVGTRMLIREDGRCVGTIGGGCMENEILHCALHMLHQQKEAPPGMAGQDESRREQPYMAGQDESRKEQPDMAGQSKDRKEQPAQQIVTADMTEEAAVEEGMVCGGKIRVYLEIVS